MTEPPPKPDVEPEQMAEAPDPEPKPEPAPAPPAYESKDALRALDPGALRASRLVSCIVSGVAVLGVGAVLVIELIFNWWGQPARVFVWGGFFVLVFVLAWLSLVWTRLSHNATVYRVNDDGLEIRRGVIWRRVISVPRSRIQHTDVAQGPLLRRYGLAQLTVHTAATRTPAVSLWGLAHETATSIREDLRQTGRDDGV